MGMFDKFFGQKKARVDFYPTKALALMDAFNKSKDFYLKCDCIKQLEELGDKHACEILSRIFRERVEEAVSLYRSKASDDEALFSIEPRELNRLPGLSGAIKFKLTDIAAQAMANATPAFGTARPEERVHILRARNHNLELSLICAKSLLKLRDISAKDYIKITLALARHKMTQDMREAEKMGDAELHDLTVMANEALAEQIRLIEEGILEVKDGDV